MIGETEADLMKFLRDFLDEQVGLDVADIFLDHAWRIRAVQKKEFQTEIPSPSMRQEWFDTATELVDQLEVGGRNIWEVVAVWENGFTVEKIDTQK